MVLSIILYFIVPGDRSRSILPSSEYDDPAALERTMDDIAMDLASQDFQDCPPLTPAQGAEQEEEVETPRAANIIVNNVELTDGGDDDKESASDEYEETEGEGEDDNRGKLASNLKRFGGFEALDRLEADRSLSVSERRDEDAADEDGNLEQSFFDRTLDQTLDEVEVELEKIKDSFGFSIQVIMIVNTKYRIQTGRGV